MLSHRVLCLLCACIFCVSGLAWAAPSAKQIKLRNGFIETPEPGPAMAAAATVNGERSGPNRLFLVQFAEPVGAARRNELRAGGVDLIYYVPDDAYVARLRNVQPAALRRMENVRWVGSYTLDHKVHRKLRERVQRRKGDEAHSVSVLLAENTPAGEVAAARQNFQNLQGESRSRLGTVLRGTLRGDRFEAVARSENVLWVEPGPDMKLYDEVATDIVAGEAGPLSTLVHEAGYTGAGVTVAVADSGLHAGEGEEMHPDLAGRVTAFFYYGNLTDAADEHSHGTHVAGIVAGNGALGTTDENNALYGLGVAPGVNIVAQRLFDANGGYEPPPSFETMTRHAVRAGAEIGSNSWGDDTQGRYDLSAAEFDALVRDADELAIGDQPYILEFSAGNAGPGGQTIGSPAVAKNVIATGASQNNRPEFFIYEDGQEAMADFSSRGPCEDGRIKPDIVAPGTWIASLRSVYGNDEFAWAVIDNDYIYQGGTSQAGPHVSGAAAVFVQYYRAQITNQTPSPALVKAALINSAADLDDSVETGPVPNMDEGWGRLDLRELILSERRYEYLDQSVTLATGQSYERTVVVSSRDQPLIITLTYTDVPGLPAALPALVNDLDLEVIAPDNRVYRGNQFVEGASAPDTGMADNLNNVEAVHLWEPLPGEYTIRVRARHVAEDARRDTAQIDQDFALVVSAEIPPPGVGVVFFDRPTYTAPSSIGIKLIDADLRGQPSVQVVLRSTTEPGGEAVILRAAGALGAFTNHVPTRSGSPVVDGRLQISHGDRIEAVYQDASAGVRLATARGDLQPPVITAVRTTNQFGGVVVAWQTDEPANALVRYGTGTPLTQSAADSAFVTSHEVGLTDLVAGQTYRFLIVSADEAGNVRTNDNGGALFSVVAVATAPVLVVDAYDYEDFEAQTIPITEYTRPLEQIGVGYNVWDVSTRGSPPLSVLRPFSVVIWRISDSIYSQSPHSTLSAAEQSTIQTYLNGGGSFFMSSMEILSRIGDVPFRRNVLQVAQFVPNSNPFEQCTECDEDYGVPAIEGSGTDPLAVGMFADLDYSAYPEIEFLGLGPDFSDTFTPGTNAAPVLYEFFSGKPCGMKFPRTGLDSTGRVVFFSFPLDTVPENTPAPGNRVTLLRNALQFLAPGLGGSTTIALDRPEYTVPGLVTAEVANSELAGTGQATVGFSSDSQPGPVFINAAETARPGLFRGFVSLVSSASPGVGELRAIHGDTISARFTHGPAAVTASATIDTIRPIISAVAAEAEYETATIIWETSEACDALVQFGESPLLGRTAYIGELDFIQEVSLTGLTPDRVYYYQVVSRDLAGNAAIDDNSGRLYTLRTLRPVSPPWFDNMEAGPSHWSQVDIEDTQSRWVLGVPNNDVPFNEAEPAHSPVNAWGSNLDGAPIDYAETFLVSPAIDLTGGNRATLHFWHNYDFTERSELDIVEGGQLLIITNTSVAPVPLADYADLTFGWEPAEVDLTPYLGRVVFLVWYYQLLSFETVPRPGWLLDDVSVQVTNVVPGILNITNTLWQARWVLNGPLNRSGQGTFASITNAPPGQYTVTFSDVPFYVTPSSQTRTLAASAIEVFTGAYSFADSNNNGMADAWEQENFGQVAPGRNRQTDTDSDGATDYAEFVAGTNPNAPGSRLGAILRPQLSGSWRLEWPSTIGRAYRVEGSANGVSWTPVSGWLQAISATTAHLLPPPQPGAPHLFRIQVQP